MIREVTKYVLGSYTCSTKDNLTASGNIFYEFEDIPTLKEIRDVCLKYCNETYTDYKWLSCTINNLQFLSKEAYDQLKGK